jgi:hypothetical protein
VALPPRGRPPVLASARAGRPLPRALLRPLRPRLRRSSRRSRWSPSLLFLHRRTARRRALRRVAPHPRLAFPKHPAVGPRAVATVPGAPSAPARAFLLAGPPAHRSLPSRHPVPSQSPPTLLPGRGPPRSADPVGSACALRFSRQQAPHATPRRPALRHPPATSFPAPTSAARHPFKAARQLPGPLSSRTHLSLHPHLSPPEPPEKKRGKKKQTKENRGSPQTKKKN